VGDSGYRRVDPGALYPLVAGVADNTLALTLGPLAFMFAVLRYRLYDLVRPRSAVQIEQLIPAVSGLIGEGGEQRG
jgi:hypothetical protein